MHKTGDPRHGLPNDPAALRAMLLAALAERDSLAAERDALTDRNERLQHLQFSPRSEQLQQDEL